MGNSQIHGWMFSSFITKQKVADPINHIGKPSILLPISKSDSCSIVVISSWVLCFHQSVNHTLENCWLTTSFGVIAVARPSFNIKAWTSWIFLLREEHDEIVCSSCCENTLIVRHECGNILVSSTESDDKLASSVFSYAIIRIVEVPSVGKTWCVSISTGELVLIKLKQSSKTLPIEWLITA